MGKRKLGREWVGGLQLLVGQLILGQGERGERGVKEGRKEEKVYLWGNETGEGNDWVDWSC